MAVNGSCGISANGNQDLRQQVFELTPDGTADANVENPFRIAIKRPECKVISTILRNCYDQSLVDIEFNKKYR
jgi:hypothetical protein